MDSVDSTRHLQHSQDLQKNLQNVFDYIGVRKYNIFILIFATIFFWIDSLELQSLSLTSKVAYCEYQEGNDVISQYVVAASNGGQAIGGFLLGMFSDKYGRKLGQLVVILSTLILGCISALPRHIYGLIIARFFMGIGLGGVHISATYVQENFPSKNNHLWMLLIQALGLTGGLVEGAVALGMIPRINYKSWRYFILVTVAPTLFLVVQYPFVYESPRWLILNGHYKQAKDVLQKQAKWSKITLPEDLLEKVVPQSLLLQEHKIREQQKYASKLTTKQQIEKFNKENKELGRYLAKPKVALTVSILLYNWFTIGLIVQGAVQILTNIASNGRTPFTCDTVTRHVIANRSDYINNFGQQASEIAGCIFVVALMYVMARKYALSSTYCLVGFSLIIQSVITRPEYLQKYWQGKVLIAFQYVVIACVFGDQSILYLMSNEVVATQFRSRILGYSTFMYRMGAFVSSFIVVQMNQNKGASKALALMAALAMSSVIFMVFMPFDQKNKGLIEEAREENPVQDEQSDQLVRNQNQNSEYKE